VLISLGKEELADMVERDEEIEVTCEYCHESYLFSKAELKRLREWI
jgi:molecular chaperone Hsp33